MIGKKQTNKQTKRKQCLICELLMKGYKVDRVAFEIYRIVHHKVKSGMKIVNLVFFFILVNFLIPLFLLALQSFLCKRFEMFLVERVCQLV